MIFDNKDVTITPEGWLRVPITDEMVDWAKPRAEELGCLRNSIRQGKGNLVGMLGEAAVLKALPNSVSANTYQHDITWSGFTLEIKSKDRTQRPAAHYEASVAAYNPNQRADFYVFTTCERAGKHATQYHTCFIHGLMDKKSYIEKGQYLREGDIVDTNRFPVKANCYNMPYNQMVNFEFLDFVYTFGQ